MPLLGGNPPPPITNYLAPFSTQIPSQMGAQPTYVGQNPQLQSQIPQAPQSFPQASQSSYTLPPQSNPFVQQQAYITQSQPQIQYQQQASQHMQQYIPSQPQQPITHHSAAQSMYNPYQQISQSHPYSIAPSSTYLPLGAPTLGHLNNHPSIQNGKQ